jgi:hypothetical protein
MLETRKSYFKDFCGIQTIAAILNPQEGYFGGGRFNSVRNQDWSI